MAAYVAIFARILVLLVSTGFLEVSCCSNDIRLTPPGDVLFGTGTPVYFLKANARSSAGHTLSERKNAMTEVKRILPVFPETANRTNKIEDECVVAEAEWTSELDFHPEFLAPDIIYPKIVVVIDFSLLLFHGKLGKLLGYLVAFWNGVDLLFRTLEHPKLRLHIAGIVIAENDKALSFLWKKNSDSEANSVYAAELFARFMETEGTSWSKYFGHYDMAILMTSLVFCRPEGDKCKHDEWDLAEERSREMCDDVQTRGPTGRGLLSVDGNDWMRIRRAAKLVEDMLNPWGLEGETFDCPKYDNAVSFSLGSSATDKPDWSECYLNSFKKRFNKKKVSCMFTKPKVKTPLPRLLLGRIFDKEKQCRVKTNIQGHSTDMPGRCRNLWCRGFNFGFHEAINIPPADGTSCADEHICFRRRCVRASKLL